MNVILVLKVVASQTVNVVDKLLLSFRQRTLRSFYIHVKLLGQACELETKLLLVDHKG